MGPAVGMMIQNDQVIAKGPDLFNEYNHVIASGGQDSPGRNMTLLRMENLVGPIADNIVAIKKLLDDPTMFPEHPRNDDDVKALQMKQKLLEAVAAQEASLDIINGFVTTQQLGDMQHEGFGYITAIQGNDVKDPNKALGVSSPPPGMSDPNYAGLKPDANTIDLATVPGLSLGYNPISHLRDGLQWTQGETKTRENTAAAPLMQTASACGAAPAPTATPH